MAEDAGGAGLMPCDRIVQARAQKLGLPVPQGLTHEEITKLTGAVGHREAHDRIGGMGDADFKALLARMEKLRRKKELALHAYLETQGKVPAYTGAGIA